MKVIHEGDRIHAEIRPLTPGTMNRLVVTVTANTVTNASADGVNEALEALAELHAEIYDAIDDLMAARAKISGRNGG